MVIGQSASEKSEEAASGTADAAATAALSSDLDNTIFADVRVGQGMIGTYSFESFEDLNAALTVFIQSVQARGVRHRFKPRIVLEEPSS